MWCPCLVLCFLVLKEVSSLRLNLFRQCLRALDAISVECPEECLRHGVAAAVLQFFDFFSTSKQVRLESLCISFVACPPALLVLSVRMRCAHHLFVEIPTESGAPDRHQHLQRLRRRVCTHGHGGCARAVQPPTIR